MADRLSDSMREELEAIAGRTPRRILDRSTQGGRAGTLAALFRRGLIVRGGANGGYVITDAGRAAIGVEAPIAADLRADQPHPWRVEYGKRYGGSRPFWIISRYNPTGNYLFNTETVLTRRGEKRWYDQQKAQAECDRMNAAGVDVPDGDQQK